LCDGIVGVTSTAPCPAEVADGLAAAGLRLLQVYGSSETAGLGWRWSSQESYRLFPWWTAADGGRSVRRCGAGAVPLPDVVTWQAPDRFQVGARVDGAIQVGGVNIHPDSIADLLRDHPEVAQAAVRVFPTADGPRLKAAIVPAAGADRVALADRLGAWAAERLLPVERPRSITVLDRLPRTLLGKGADWSPQP
jgi:4-coumarate--CoA ligase